MSDGATGPLRPAQVYLACVMSKTDAENLALLLERVRFSKGGLYLDALEVVSAREALKTVTTALKQAETLP